MTTAFDALARARRLVPLLASQGRTAERLGRPHDAVVEAMDDAGLFGLLTPTVRGGRRVDLVEYLETIASLGEGCLSSAWVCSFYAVHSWMVCLFPEPAQDEVLTNGQVRAPGLVAPGGAARPVNGGYRVSGRWPFASGVWHAEWALVTAMLRDDEAAPPGGVRMFIVPRREFEIIETWDVDGMAGTGSHDVAIADSFVPAHRSLDLLEMATGSTPGAMLYADDPLFRLPLPPLLAFVAAAPALGAARATVAEFRERAKERTRSWARGKHFQRATVQMRLAEADMHVRCAELLLRQTAAELAVATPELPIVERARLRMQSSWALTLCTQAVQSMAEVAGAAAHQQDDPLQRRVRDLRMMRCHVIFEPDATAEVYGRTLFGLDPDTLLV